MDQPLTLDRLDLALLTALDDNPRAGELELSRITKVARATVNSRIRRLTEGGVIRSWSPTLDPTASGFPQYMRMVAVPLPGMLGAKTQMAAVESPAEGIHVSIW